MNDTLREVAKRQREKTPFCERYIEMLQAGLDKVVQDAVMFNIVNWQWKKGELRTDRQFKHYQKGEKIAPSLFSANEGAIMDNKCDAKVLEEMVAFKEANSLDMREAGEAWFGYVTEGGELPGR